MKIIFGFIPGALCAYNPIIPENHIGSLPRFLAILGALTTCQGILRITCPGSFCREGLFRGQYGITLSCRRNISLQKKRSELSRHSLNINYSNAFCHMSPKSSECFTDVTSSLICTVLLGEKMIASSMASIWDRTANI